MPIKDLGVAVDMLNRGARACGRRLDFAHAPVQFSNGNEDAHYEPLRHLDISDARIYLGLIDPTDGIGGALQRIEVVRRHRADFGLATACGWGRRPLGESVEALLRLERDVVEKVSADPRLTADGHAVGPFPARPCCNGHLGVRLAPYHRPGLREGVAA